MSQQASAFSLALTEASEKSKLYDWMSAARLYAEALASSKVDPHSIDHLRVNELLAGAYFRAAFQAPNHNEFRRIMGLSKEAFDQAADENRRAGLEASSKRIRVKSIFTEYWLASPDIAKMKQLIEKCVTTSAETLAVAEKGDARALLYAQKDELTYICDSLLFLPEWTLAREQFRRAAIAADDAIRGFEAHHQDEDLLECLWMSTLLFAIHAQSVLPVEEFKQLEQKTIAIGKQIEECSARMGTPYAFSLRDEALSLIAYGTEGNPAKALQLLEKAIENGKATRDSLLVGRFYGGATVMAVWVDTEDAEQRRTLLERAAEKFGPEAVRNFEVSNHPQWINWAYGFWAECPFCLARFVETDADKKRKYVWKTTEIAKKGMEYEAPGVWANASHPLAKALYLLAKWSSDPSEKKKLLQQALPIREQLARNADTQFPHSFDRAVWYYYLGLVKAELGTIEQDPKSRAIVLEDASSFMVKCVEWAGKWRTADRLVWISIAEESYGDILLQISKTNTDKKRALLSVDAYKHAVDYLREAGFPSHEAPIWWKIGNVYESIGDHKEASAAFKTSADTYQGASEKAPATTNTFRKLASYMRAWTNISDARLNHSDDRFSASAESYISAAKTLERAKQWDHLAQHYLACASLERGEALSREEKHQESIDSFRSALHEFQQTVEMIEKKLDSLSILSERAELENWLQITRGREKYSQGRLDLEEAIVLDREGDEEASSGKYRTASDIFSELMNSATTQQARQEFETLVEICTAWSRMKEAEVKASPELYSLAAKSFNNAQEVTASKLFRLLALANSSMCRALEAGTRFRQTRDTKLYSEIKRCLETASDFYGQAGLNSAAEWTRATQRLFDAFVYLSSAESEIDSRKKAELYHLAEKHLELAGRLYGQAGYPRKKQEALRHLQIAREEKQLLLTPLEALADSPAIESVTVAPVSLLKDQAVGLERFEAANVVGNLALPRGELGVGTDLTLELELANVGKTPAMLMKLENVAPDGMEIVRENMPHQVEDNYIDMKGKTLEYLKTHEVKVPMKAKRKGTFRLQPRVLFVDEKGGYRSYEFEPVSVTIKELGIGGWLKGPK